MTARLSIVWDESLAEHVLETQGPDELVRRIEGLDGSERTLVTAYRGDAHVVVGGDASTGLVLYVTFDGTTFHQLSSGGSDVQGDEDEVVVMAGGQAGGYPRRLVVSAEAAKAVAAHFATEGVLDPDYSWEAS